MLHTASSWTCCFQVTEVPTDIILQSAWAISCDKCIHGVIHGILPDSVELGIAGMCVLRT